MSWRRSDPFFRPAPPRAPSRNFGAPWPRSEPVLSEPEVDEEPSQEPSAIRETARGIEVPNARAPEAPLDVDAGAEELRAAVLRTERERERVLAETRATVVREMLPVLDNLDRSLSGAVGSSDRALVEGVRLVRTQFEDALARLGLERIESLGRPFDPLLFDAVAVVDVDDPALVGTVTDEWQRGYKLGDTIVCRPKVRVGQ